MPATRNILKHIKVEIARERRKCHASKAHSIQTGEKHLAVYEATGRQNICLQCARPVLNIAAAHLQETTDELFP
jgi:hypothetical protein